MLPSRSPVAIIAFGDNANIRRKKFALFAIDFARCPMVLSPEEAGKAIRSGRQSGPIEVPGRLDLNNFDCSELPSGLRCYELDATGSQLTHLPADLQIDGRLVLDNCAFLKSLPVGLSAGSISLRNCA